jgi:hypothetical protein
MSHTSLGPIISSRLEEKENILHIKRTFFLSSLLRATLLVKRIFTVMFIKWIHGFNWKSKKTKAYQLYARKDAYTPLYLPLQLNIEQCPNI